MLSDIQHHLLQYFCMTNISSENDAVKVLDDIINHTQSSTNADAEALSKEIQSLNYKLKNYDLEVVDGRDEISGEKVLALVNTSSNSIAEKAKFYDKLTTELFSKILQACIISEYGFVSEIECVNFNIDLERRKTDVQNTILKLIKDKWLVSKNGKISLSARSILEMEQLIKTNFRDHAKQCSLCKTFVLQGNICTSCEARIHFYCSKRYFRKSKSPLCPSCHSEWVDAMSNADRYGSEEEEHENEVEDQEITEPDSPVLQKRRKKN